MTLADKLIKKFEQLPDSRKKQVLDFVKFLKEKEQRELEDIMDNVIIKNKEALDELGK